VGGCGGGERLVDPFGHPDGGGGFCVGGCLEGRGFYLEIRGSNLARVCVLVLL